jgi:hypothetical protein
MDNIGLLQLSEMTTSERKIIPDVALSYINNLGLP